jgi:hypothetical protein
MTSTIRDLSIIAKSKPDKTRFSTSAGVPEKVPSMILVNGATE